VPTRPLQRRLPAEWEAQSQVMLTWPRAGGDFAPLLAAVEDNFERLIATLARFVPVQLNAPPGGGAQLARRLAAAGVVSGQLNITEVESDDVWARDHGPITVVSASGPLHLDFEFNGWGGKFEAAHDNRINRNLAQVGALPYPLQAVPMVLEGGALESDGRGCLLTTARCVLSSTRNRAMTAARFEQAMAEHLGVERVLWLAHGDLLGDDTDGHIDTLARFCNAETIAYQACEEPGDAHFESLQAMAEELRALRNAHNAPYHLVPLPLPQAIADASGRRLPAGYANFLISNAGVLVPTYGDAADEVALARLRAAFPQHEVVGVDCRALIQQYGSLHCVTMQIPAPMFRTSSPDLAAAMTSASRGTP
jgi:agmatine/peptidylarginine deiminase